MSNPQFEVFRSPANNQFYFRLRAQGNSEIILCSEGYTAKQSCENGIASVKRNASVDGRYERRQNRSFTFVLKAGNGEIIGRSEGYNTPTHRDEGIESVKRDAPEALIVDLT